MSDKLLELEQTLPQIGPALESRRIGESLGKAIDKLRDADRTIIRLRAILDIAKEVDFSNDPIQANALSELFDEAESLATDLEKARSADELNTVETMYSEFTRSLVNVDRSLRIHWRRIAERDFRPLIAIGELLASIDVADDLARRLRACGEEAISIKENIPADQLREAIRRVRKTRNKLERERTSMTKKPDVDLFLTALADGRATLRMVTEGVREWLDQNGALDRFGIQTLS